MGLLQRDGQRRDGGIIGLCWDGLIPLHQLRRLEIGQVVPKECCTFAGAVAKLENLECLWLLRALAIPMSIGL